MHTWLVAPACVISYVLHLQFILWEDLGGYYSLWPTSTRFVPRPRVFFCVCVCACCMLLSLYTKSLVTQPQAQPTQSCASLGGTNQNAHSHHVTEGIVETHWMRPKVSRYDNRQMAFPEASIWRTSSICKPHWRVRHLAILARLLVIV